MTSDPTILTRDWSYPTSVRFGPGRIAELPAVCKEIGMEKPLLVTDPGLRKVPMIDSTLAGLGTAGLGETVFSDIRANPVGRNADDGLAFYRRNGCDGVIAFRGGSALDVGKAIALMVGQTRPLWDFEDRDDWYTRVDVAAIYLDLPDVGFQGVLDWVLVLRKDIGIPNTLAELGVKEDDLDTLVAEAVDDPATSGNPRPVSAIGMWEMFVNAIRGRMA